MFIPVARRERGSETDIHVALEAVTRFYQQTHDKDKPFYYVDVKNPGESANVWEITKETFALLKSLVLRP